MWALTEPRLGKSAFCIELFSRLFVHVHYVLCVEPLEVIVRATTRNLGVHLKYLKACWLSDLMSCDEPLKNLKMSSGINVKMWRHSLRTLRFSSSSAYVSVHQRTSACGDSLRTLRFISHTPNSWYSKSKRLFFHMLSLKKKKLQKMLVGWLCISANATASNLGLYEPWSLHSSKGSKSESLQHIGLRSEILNRVVISGKSQPAKNRNLSRLISNLNRLKERKNKRKEKKHYLSTP